MKSRITISSLIIISVSILHLSCKRNNTREAVQGNDINQVDSLFRQLQISWDDKHDRILIDNFPFLTTGRSHNNSEIYSLPQDKRKEFYGKIKGVLYDMIKKENKIQGYNILCREMKVAGTFDKYGNTIDYNPYLCFSFVDSEELQKYKSKEFWVENGEFTVVQEVSKDEFPIQSMLSIRADGPDFFLSLIGGNISNNDTVSLLECQMFPIQFYSNYRSIKKEFDFDDLRLHYDAAISIHSHSIRAPTPDNFYQWRMIFNENQRKLFECKHCINFRKHMKKS